jgi:cytochrome c
MRLALAAGLFLAAGLASAAGDAARGEAIYSRCAACHSLARDRTGPRHCGLFGRRAGSVPGFDYSAAMRRSGIVWDARSLDRFLADPLATVPGTTMGYAGVKDAQERTDLVAYLRRAGACARGASPRGAGLKG